MDKNVNNKNLWIITNEKQGIRITINNLWIGNSSTFVLCIEQCNV